MIYDIAIIGAGCAGLSLAYQLTKKKNSNQKIIILDNKQFFTKDRTWSFWKTNKHDFEDCLDKQWSRFNIKFNNKKKIFESLKYPYQTINSLKFYKKIQQSLTDNFELKLNTKIKKIQQTSNYFEIFSKNKVIKSKFIFDSRVPKLNFKKLYQHFFGIEIQTDKDFFDSEEVSLMDFDCDQKHGVHFFYILPFSKRKALIETTWLSKLNNLEKKKYVDEIKNYIEKKLKLKRYHIIREEIGAIPMFRKKNENKKGYINIGLRGNINRMSTGYTFPYIQKHSEFIARSIKNFKINSPISQKYEFLDTLFIKVLQNNTKIMPSVFFKIFDENNQDSVIRFLSSNSSFYDDLKVMSKIPKLIFLKQMFN